jgi:hypothetical protein
MIATTAESAVEGAEAVIVTHANDAPINRPWSVASAGNPVLQGEL